MSTGVDPVIAGDGLHTANSEKKDRLPVEPSNKLLQHPVLGPLRCTYAYEVDSMWLPRFGLSARPEPIGVIWETPGKQPFLASPEALAVLIYSADWADVLAGTAKEGEFTKLQITAYEGYARDRKRFESQVEQGLFKHYHERIAMTDYPGEGFEPVDSVAPLLLQCDHWQLAIPWQVSGPRRLKISCSCPWEDEHGFTAEFEDEQLVGVE